MHDSGPKYAEALALSLNSSSKAVLFSPINLYFQEHLSNNGERKHAGMKRKKQQGKSI